MNTLTLRITPGDFRALLDFLRLAADLHTTVPLLRRPLVVAVLHTYLLSLTPARLYAWQVRDRRKAYTLKLPLPVALALHTEMQHALLTGSQQGLLGTLDQAMTNYRDPMQPTLIGELMERL